MKRTCTISAAFLVISAIASPAYHVGEKSPQGQRNSHLPHITLVTSDRIEFSVTLDEPVTVAVYDVRGNTMMNNGLVSEIIHPSNGRGSCRLSFEASASGVYFVTLRNSAGITAIGVAELR